MQFPPDIPDISPFVQELGYMEQDTGNKLAALDWESIDTAAMNPVDRYRMKELFRERLRKLLWLAHSQIEYQDRVSIDQSEISRLAAPERTFLELLNGIIAHSMSEMCEGHFMENPEHDC